MKRVMVIGCCGAGKSTFSKALSKNLGLGLFHLDQYYWKSDWKETNKTEWEGMVERLAEKDEWIIDGNYGGTMDIRISRADTIVYLDYSTVSCLWRITKRIVKYHGKERPDMPTGCKERFDLEFYHYVATYNLLRRKKLMSKMAKLKYSKSIFILKNDKQVAEFLKFDLEDKARFLLR